VRLEIGTGASQIAGMPERDFARTDAVLFKRYANLRLYNTVSATYLCLDDLGAMILGGERFIVRDAETGADITRDISTGCTER
jgi:polyhydroxyalkanoate synthesis regulator protein